MPASGDTKIVSDGGMLTLAGDITSAADLNLDFGGTSTGANTFSGALGSGISPDVIKSDAGTWILTAQESLPRLHHRQRRHPAVERCQRGD